MSERILVASSNSELAELVLNHLFEAGYQASAAVCSTAFWGALGSFKPGLLLLDFDIEGTNAVDLCKQLRSRGNALPIVIMSNRTSEADRVYGLDSGADDYITRPCGSRELLARVAALLRRAKFSQAIDSGRGNLSFGELEINLDQRSVKQRGEVLRLTSTEFDLVSFLAQRAGHPVSKEELLDAVWHYEAAGYADTVKTHINRLRSKIETDPANPKFVQTVRGVGYVFAA
jgi:two-component system OmpR family response regulator